MRILIVEDDAAILDVLAQRLGEQNYAIDIASDGLKGWEYASTYEYDLLLLDVMLPQLDGMALCQKIRLAGQTLPILMLTAQDTTTAKIMGLDAGADDFVVKPFDLEELVARIRALLRRSRMNPLPILTWGDLWLNSSSQEVSYAGTVLNLTAKEYSLLEMMLRESHHVFSNDEILDSLWSFEEFPVDATVRSHMRRLRNKLSAVGAPPDLIATAHGRGYYLKPLDPEIADPIATDTKDLPTSTTDRQTQYLELLNQTWQTHRSTCLERIQTLRSTLELLQTNRLTPTAQTEAHRVAHTLVGTLGTFGIQQAMEMARAIEQELHPDIYPDASQASYLQSLLAELQQQIETTKELQYLPGQPDRPPLSSTGNFGDTEISIMIVDDDPIFLQTLPRQLQGYGFQVSTLADPQQFWTVLEGVHPDVLILDIQMPHLSGLELCQVLRSSPQWQKIPVMFLSVFADAQTQHEAFAAGADDYLCKPITAQHLHDRIQQRLHRIQALVN
jgi:DNA-binding response OmpR family regulator/HPt (histidine-containing phosphotransfer) domain-containing protein